MNYLEVQKHLTDKQFPLFGGEFNVTLIGVRSNEHGVRINEFDDDLFVTYQSQGQRVWHKFDFTTDPSNHYLLNPVNDAGCAILVEGHYPKCWKLGKHRGKYLALKQVGEMTVYRDNNLDTTLDMSKQATQTGYFGINLHRNFKTIKAKSLGKASAGCQVMSNPLSYDVLMALLQLSASKYGNCFSYTLLKD